LRSRGAVRPELRVSLIPGNQGAGKAGAANGRQQ
jgi:hypothetical protein